MEMNKIALWFRRSNIKKQLYFAFFLVGIIAGVASYIAGQVGPLPSVLLLTAAVGFAVFAVFMVTNIFTNLLKNISVAADQLAQGNTDIKVNIGYSREALMVDASFESMIKSIKTMINDTDALTDAIRAGKLDARTDAGHHVGDYKVLIEGLNHCLDEVIGPLNMTAEYVERISKGNMPEKITDEYYGDFNEIKNNLNACIDGLGGLVESSNILKKMAENDYTCKVEGQYQGLFAETAQDVNTVRERVLMSIQANERLAAGDFMELYEAFSKIGKRSEEDRLIPSYLAIVETLMGIIDEVVMLGNATVEGKLDKRADINKYPGAYRRIVEGFNNTLDAVIGPLNMAAEYVERIANGNTPPKITDNYNGDFNEIKNNLNTCIEAISVLVEEVGVTINAGIEGQLDLRANADRGKGVYHKILAGLNETMDALIAPVNEAILVAGQMEQGQLNIEMTGDYQGDNAKLKEGLNITISQIGFIIGQVSEVLGQIADGNLDTDIENDYIGDFSGISLAIKLIIKSLNEVMGDINNAAEEVADGAQQASEISQALAQGASEQASAIEQLTSAITEIAAQTKHNATNANQANDLALNARENAVNGNEQMKEMLGAMEAINESSTNISKIIKVIDEIAFQTNILALNAAVEAARAGQHGKGFAVVAEEVRNLAARSASAAKETTELIEGSIRNVQSGTTIAHDTAEALKKIVDGISQASELVGEIATASNEQATGIAQVDQGIVQVSQVVQNNSSLAQQSAQASEELLNGGRVLKDNIAKFRLKKSYMGYQRNGNGLGSKGDRKPEMKLVSSGFMGTATDGDEEKINLNVSDFGKY